MFYRKFHNINYFQYAQQLNGDPIIIAQEILSNVQENYQQLRNQEWILGVANAGQGAVIGPIVYTVCYWPKKYQALILDKINLDESKQLPRELTSHFFKIFNELKGKILEYDIFQLNAAFLSSTQLAAIPVNLKEITHQIVLDLILQSLTDGFNITGMLFKYQKECYMYKFGNDQEQKSYIDGELRRRGKKVKVIVEGKGDVLFKVVSASSICAKEVWQGEMDKIKNKIKGIGNGHPNDFQTQQFMYHQIVPVFGYSEEIRFDWKTTKEALAQNGLNIEYYDENSNPELKARTQKFRKLNIQQMYL